MMTVRQNITIAGRRIGKRFWTYFKYLLIFSVFGVLAYLFAAAAEVWYYSQQGVDMWSVIFYDYYLALYGEEYVAEAFPDLVAVLSDQLTSATYVFVSAYSLIESVLSSLDGILFSLPMAFLFLSAVNQHPSDLKSAIKYVGRSIPLALLMTLKVFLWSLLFIVPGIIKAFSYSQAFYVRIENPELSANECLKRSSEIMNGRKGKLFVLLIIYGVVGAFAGSVAEIAASVIDMFISVLSMTNPAVYLFLSSVISSLITLFVSLLISVYQNMSMAVFYVDAKRSWLDDVEQDLRYNHETGRDGSNPFEFTSEATDGQFSDGRSGGENSNKDVNPFE